VALGAVSGDAVDGIFVDDPAGYGQEHPSIQTAVQLTATEIAALQLGTQTAYNKAFQLFLPAKKYFWNAMRDVPAGPGMDPAACMSWMRTQCTRPANESAVLYPPPSVKSLSDAKLSLAAFLVTRGAHSYISANQATIENQDTSDPFYAMFQLDVGEPEGGCTESVDGVFSRSWSRGHAMVNCTHAATGTLEFK